MNESQKVNWTQLKALLRVHFKLMLRRFHRERGLLINVLLALLIFGPLVALLTFISIDGYLKVEGTVPFVTLAGILITLWLFWLLSPIIFTSLIEQANITRLLPYPINSRTLMLSLLVGTSSDYSSYFLIPIFLAIVYGFGLVWHPVAGVVWIVMGVAFLHLVVAHQLVVTVIGGLVESRRLRDISLILFSVLGTFCYFIQFGLNKLIERLMDFSSIDFEAISNIDPLSWAQWFPTGALARTVQYSMENAWGNALLWLLYSLAWLMVLGWIWYRLLIRLATGHGYSLRLPEPEKKATAVATKKQSDGPSWLPADLYLLFRNELRALWRIPQRRIGVIQANLMPLFFLIPFFFSDSDRSSSIDLTAILPIWVGLVLPLYSMFVFWSNAQNMLGWEGYGLPTLLLSPVKRVYIFWGKSVALYLATLLPVLVMSVLIGRLRWDWSIWAAIAVSLLIGWTTLAVTAVTSVLLPIPVRADAKRSRSVFSTGGSAKTGCLSVLLVPPSVFVIGLPPGLLLALAYALELPWLAWLGVLLSAVYTAVVFYSGTVLASRLLLEREPEFLARMKLANE